MIVLCMGSISAVQSSQCHVFRSQWGWLSLFPSVSSTGWVATGCHVCTPMLHLPYACHASACEPLGDAWYALFMGSVLQTERPLMAAAISCPVLDMMYGECAVGPACCWYAQQQQQHVPGFTRCLFGCKEHVTVQPAILHTLLRIASRHFCSNVLHPQLDASSVYSH